MVTSIRSSRCAGRNRKTTVSAELIFCVIGSKPGADIWRSIGRAGTARENSPRSSLSACNARPAALVSMEACCTTAFAESTTRPCTAIDWAFASAEQQARATTTELRMISYSKAANLKFGA